MGMEIEPWMMILLMQAITLVLGMFLDPVGIILLVLPIFFPIVVGLGYDPIWFLILFQLNLCIGYISPPFGYKPVLSQDAQPQDADRRDLPRDPALPAADAGDGRGDLPVSGAF